MTVQVTTRVVGFGIGDRGDHVAQLHAALRALGIPLDIERYFSEATKEAVVIAQMRLGITPANGVYDDRLRIAMNQYLDQLQAQEATE